MNRKNYAEVGQDDWVIEKLEGKRNGFFVEVGAGHATIINNTWKLEEQYDWTGLCIEPLPEFHPSYEDRKCILIKKAVNIIKGNRRLYTRKWGSVLTGRTKENFGDNIEVKCDTLMNILEEGKAPKTIDYLSIDVESFELTRDIIMSIDFTKYDIRCMTLEIKSDSSSGLESFLASRGYKNEPFPILDIGFHKCE